MSSSSSVSGTQAGASSTASTRTPRSGMCEWCGKAAKTRCSKCRQALFCDTKCIKNMWKEHKKTCKVLSEAQRLAHEVALAELGGKQPFWTGLDEIPQQIIAGYMDMVSLCRTDSAMTGVEERRMWQKALKGLKCEALSKWPKHSNRDNFAGVRWGELRRIELEGFKIEVMVDPKDPRRVYRSEDLNYFGGVCQLGYRDIALLMVKSGSVDINGKDKHGVTPLFFASNEDMVEVVQALVEAGADLNQANKNGATPLYAASQNGHLDVVRCLAEAGADLNRAMSNCMTPLHGASYKGH